jgi:DNA-binding NarL/FixJ family response regulator
MKKNGIYVETIVKKLVIIEDNDQLRDAYSLIIRGLEGFEVVNTYDNCEAAIKKLTKDDPDLILIDITLPGMSGIQGISKIKRINPEIKILVVTVHDDNENVFNAFCAGAIGYITKDADYKELIDAIEQVFYGGAPMTPKIANKIISSFHTNPKTPLTTRETEVLRELSQGKSYDYIAIALSITKDTVKTHIKHIYEKLQVNNKSEAVVKAKNENWV